MAQAHSASKGLDHPLGLAVGSQGGRPGPFRRQPQSWPGFSPGVGAEGSAVIRESPGTGDSRAVEQGHSTQKEPDGGGLLLVRQHLHPGQVDGVVALATWAFS